MRAVTLLLAALLLPLLPLAQAQHEVGDPAEDPANFTWQVKGVLAVGGGGLNESGVAWLAQNGFRAVASFRGEHRDPHEAMAAQGLEHLWIPIHHASDMNVTHLRQFVAWAKAQEAAQRPMYIHCTNGWHRAAAFATAWTMQREGLSQDAAFAKVDARRANTEARAPGPLLRYEAELTGKEGLTVLLEADGAAPPPNGTLPVTVRVLSSRGPVANAEVRLSTETGRFDQRGVTDAEGRARFAFTRPTSSSFMDHLTARASAPGFVDGADQVEVFYGIEVPPPRGLTVKAWPTADALRVHVSKEGGGPFHLRIVATDGKGWLAWEATGKADAYLPLPPNGGRITVLVESWGAPEATTTVDVPPPKPKQPTPTPSAAPTPSPTPDPSPAPTPSPTPPTSGPTTAPTPSPTLPPTLDPTPGTRVPTSGVLPPPVSAHGSTADPSGAPWPGIAAAAGAIMLGGVLAATRRQWLPLLRRG